MHRLCRLSATLLLFALSGPAAAAPDLSERFGSALYAGDTAGATEVAEAAVAAAPEDGSARLAVGAGQFLGAVERLVQSFHRHGLHGGGGSNRYLGLAGLPFLRLPVPPNETPEPVSYEALREILRIFGDDPWPEPRLRSRPSARDRPTFRSIWHESGSI